MVWDKVADIDTFDTVWKLFRVSHHVGSLDEFRYFRVMREGTKHFFRSPDAYREFSGGGEGEDDATLEAVARAWRACPVPA